MIVHVATFLSSVGAVGEKVVKYLQISKKSSNFARKLLKGYRSKKI